MWKKLSDLTKNEMSELRNLKKGKIYADEDIEDAIVEYLRGNGINILSARELGFRGKPDSFHAGFSYKKKRFLLTKNAKDFLDDRKLPFNRVHGIIAIQGDMNNIGDYVMVLNRLNDIIGFGERYFGSQIKLSPYEIAIRFINDVGQIQNKRFKLEGTEYYEWINNN